HPKQQVAAVLDLIDRVGVMEAAALLLLGVQAEAQAGAVDPAIADLAQAPYSRFLRQGVCDLSQGLRVGHRPGSRHPNTWRERGRQVRFAGSNPAADVLEAHLYDSAIGLIGGATFPAGETIPLPYAIGFTCSGDGPLR